MRSRLIQNVLAAELPAVASAEGVWLTDVDGRRYLDACSGAVVTGIGHSHPRVVEATARQAGLVSFTHRGAFTSQVTEQLADRLGELTGYAGVWFVNSGSEAIEASLQFALQFFRETGEPERQWFLSSERSYHGNTLGGLSLSGHARRAVAGDLAHEFAGLPTPYAFREAGELSEDEYADDLLRRAREAMEPHRGRLAGIVLEPVGGATLGATVPPARYVQGLKSLAEEFGALFIADEVMTGFGRTGTMLASEHFGVVPDLVATGKGLGAGYTPIAATLVHERVLRAIEQGSGRIQGGHTYAGNPLSVAIASAVLDVVVDEDVVARGRRAAERLERLLADLTRRHPLVVDHRGLGMLRAFELQAPDGAGPLPQGALAARLVAAGMAEGIVLYMATGGWNEAVSIAPPLVISDDELEELGARLDRALTRVESDLGIHPQHGEGAA